MSKSMIRNGCSMGVIISIAFIYMSSIFGGGWASGQQGAAYFVSHGYLGLITPIFGTLAIVIMMWLTVEYARLSNSWTYAEFMESLYDTKVTKIVFDIVQIICMPIGVGVNVATFGSTMQMYLGGNYYFWVIVYAVIVILCTIWGTKILGRISGYMGTAILIMLSIFFITVVTHGGAETVSNYMQTKAVFTSVNQAWYWGVFKFWMLSGSMAINILPVFEPVKTRKDVTLTCVFAFIFTLAFILIVNYSLLAFSPDCLSESVPILYAINQMGANWLAVPYVAIVALATITTGNSLTFSYMKRFSKFNFIERVPLSSGIKNAVLDVLIMGIGVAVSAFGLTAIIYKGLSYTSWINSPLIAWGIPIFVTFKLIRIRQKGLGKERGCIEGVPKLALFKKGPIEKA